MVTFPSNLDSLPSLPDLGLGARAQSQASKVFSRSFVALQDASELYTARVVMALALDLGWETSLRKGATVDELLDRDNLHPQSRFPTEWMLPFLADMGLLRRDDDRYFLEGNPDLDLREIRAFAAREAPGHDPNFDLLDAVLRSIKPFFLDGKPGEHLLFAPDIFPLWLTFFRNENLAYVFNNLVTVIALREGLAPGSRILELGGGVGSFAQLLARDGTEGGYLNHISDYRFTDIAPTFLRKAQRELRGNAPGLPLSFSLLDINRPFPDQGMEDSSYDAIVGINVVHVAVDLQDALKRLRGLLKPGGRLVLGECMKPDLARPLYLEFYFKFMKGFTNVTLDAELRPCSGFLTPELWEKALLTAGFSRVRRVPDTRALMKELPAFYVGALVAEK